MKDNMRVWVYARIPGKDPDLLHELCRRIYQEAERQGYRVVGSSMEMNHDGDYRRPALYAAMAAIRTAHAEGIVTSDLDCLSRNAVSRYRLLCDIQDHGGVLITVNEDYRLQLSRDGTESLFIQRAKERNLGLPWPDIPVVVYEAPEDGYGSQV